MLQDQDIAQSVSEIWGAMLGLDIQTISKTQDRSHDQMTGLISIAGVWPCQVRLICSRTLACALTSIMFDTETHDLVDEDVEDAFRELTNMIGGSVKAMMPEPCTLSLPTIDATPGPSAPNPRHALTFACQGDAFKVEVHPTVV